MKNLLIFIVVVGIATFFATPDADRDASGQIVEQGNLDIFQIQIGDCFNDDTSYNVEETVELSGVGGVPCSTAHDNEIYAQTQMPQDAYPGREKVLAVAEDYCFAQFEPYVGKSYETSVLDITYIYPTEESWNQVNDREVSCAVFDMSYEKLVGSMRGSGI